MDEKYGSPVVRKLKNDIGEKLGLGSCPNCGDNWSWKPSGTLYTDNQDGIAGGIMICRECLEDPSSLDIDTIRTYLRSVGWDARSIREVAYTVAHFTSTE